MPALRLPSSTPFPPPSSAEEAAFWEHCKKKRLAFLNCAACGFIQHPPLPRCPNCQSEDLSWRDAPQNAELYTYTVIHHGVHDSVAAALPYNVAVVLFPTLNDLRFVSNIIDAGADDLIIGRDVRLHWTPHENGFYLPCFTLTEDA